MQVFQTATCLRHDLTFTTDGKLLVGTPSRVLLDTLGSGPPVELAPPTGAFTAHARLALGGRALAYSTPADNPHIHIWNRDTNHITVWEGAGENATDLAVSPDGATLYVASVVAVGFEWRTELRAFDIATGEARRAFPARAEHFSSLTMSADGRRLAGRHSWSVGVWDLAAPDDPVHGWVKITPGKMRNHVLGSALSADGTHLVTITSRAVALWDTSNGEPARELFRSGKHRRVVSAVACSPVRPIFATGDAAGNVFLWDFAGNVLARFDWGLNEVYALAFAPDGLRCAAAGRGKVVIWDVDT